MIYVLSSKYLEVLGVAYVEQCRRGVEASGDETWVWVANKTNTYIGRPLADVPHIYYVRPCSGAIYH